MEILHVRFLNVFKIFVPMLQWYEKKKKVYTGIAP